MGDLRDWSHNSNGVTGEVGEDYRSANGNGVASSLSRVGVAQTSAVLIDDGRWEVAENATEEIISHVQPTALSEKRRNDVILYVRRLIGDYLGFEVFQFGSVPLHTYLPDGDIDLTVFGPLNFEDALANDVRSVLLREEQNTAAQFVVKDVQLITAEVKLVKCLVQNIVVDISFNQLGGLSTLCFLEQVNTLIGKGNIFKRSIILIKAWCYYESRILGAHHGLISTYALETMVLYIFNHFHSSLNGPLAVLYKFLEYFSKFDWDNYYICLNGPICISSLPELVGDTHNNGGDLLLSDDFLRDSMEMFAVHLRVSEAPSKTFPQKHLNIVDPLRENNNLGRSVSKGNFYRIMGAFNYGACKLGYILSCPKESLADVVRKFFFNTLERHEKDPRPDVQDPVRLPIYNVFGLESPPSLEIETCRISGSIPDLESAYLAESFCNGVNNVLSLSKEMELNRSVNEPPSSTGAIIPSPKSLEGEIGTNEAFASICHSSGEAKVLATSRIRDLEISDQKSESPVGKAYHAPHLYCSFPRAGEREVRYETVVSHEETDTTSYNYHELMVSVNDDLNSVPVDESEIDSNHGYQEIVPEDQDSLQSLCGDYRNHLYNLQYGRWLYDYVLCAPIPHRHRPVIPRYATKEPWGSKRRSPGFSHDIISHSHGNGIVRHPVFYPHMNQLMIPGAPFRMEDKPKARGTGTYFPNPNTNHYRDRPSNQRWRNQAPIRSPRSNGRAPTPHQEMNFFDRSSYYEPLQYPLPHLKTGGNPGSSNSSPFDSPRRKAYPNGNGLIPPSESCVEVGSVVDQMPLDSSITPVHEQFIVLNSIPFKPAVRDVVHPNRIDTTLQLPQLEEPVLDQVVVDLYRLKDEDDFPPLST